MQFKTTLVTGGAGFIGSHIVDELLSRGARVTVYDNFTTGHREFLPVGPHPNLQIVKGDVLDTAALQAAMKGCEFVFHMQANADVRGGKDRPKVDLDQNTIATWSALEAARIQKVRGFVFASSAAVYGEPEVFPTPESYAPKQTSLYGASKMAGEAMIQAYSEYFEIRSFSFRFVSWMGERYTHGIVFHVLRKLRQDPKRLPLFGDGSQRKSYLYVKDGVNGIMHAIEKSLDLKNVYNLGHDNFLTVVEVVRVILDELGLQNVKLEFAGGKRGWVGDSPLVHLDTSLIKSLGWRPTTAIEESVRRTVRYLMANPKLLETRA